VTSVSSESAAIRAEGIVRRFGDFTAVDGIDLRVECGEVFGFLGPNGSGKTTVIKMLIGLLPLSGGDAWVDGLEVRANSEAIRERIGYMSQKFSLYDDLTVAENLQFYGRVYGLPAQVLRRRIEEAIAVQNLEPYVNRLAGKLSGGWKQRLALGCSTLHKPKIMFLDEPTAGIDPVARRELWDLIFALSGQGITFFVTTHYMDEAERCSHVAYIYYSKLIANGAPADLKILPDVNPPGSRRVEIIAPEITRVLRVVLGLRHVRNATVFGQSIHALIDSDLDLDDLTAQLARNAITLQELRPLKPSLEDVFVELTQQYRKKLEVAHA
jgi:ABC-type multidrug transport system ATPase subunit